MMHTSWGMPQAPTGGYRSLTFPITVHEMDPVKRGWYFAMQYTFVRQDGSNGNTGYTGVQPRPNPNGNGYHAYSPFSLFGKGGTVEDTDRCDYGADGGDGITCNSKIAIDDFVFGRQYLFTVNNQDDEPPNLWRGYVTDTVTGWRRQLGAWYTPEGQNGLKASQMAFAEWYAGGIPPCGNVPYTRVTYGAPYSGRVVGWVNMPWEQANTPCTGNMNFKATDAGGGAKTVELGYRKRVGPDPDPCPCTPEVNVDVNVIVNGREVPVR